MTGTLVRVFDRFADAQGARNELLNAGFSEDSVHLSSNEDEAGALDSDFKLPAKDTGTPTRESSKGSRESGKGLRGLIDTLTGKDRHGKAVTEHAAKRDSFLMTVDADGDSRLSLAADIMDRHHAVDVERRTHG